MPAEISDVSDGLITVVSHDGTELHIVASRWDVIDHQLIAYAGDGTLVAQFSPGLWSAVINEKYLRLSAR